MKRALILLLLAGCATSSDPEPKWAFDPDAEEGPHKDVEVEWWYHWGFLTDEAGGEWTLFTSFFRATKPGIPLMRYFLYDLTNLKTGERRYRSAAGDEVLQLARKMTGTTAFQPPHQVIPGPVHEKPGDPLKLRYGDDLLERTGPREYVLKTGDVDLRLRATADAMAVEGTGLTGIAAPTDMHYYSLPRLEAVGTVHGKHANGLFWYDHQWGKAWTDSTIGWTWWGLQLNDGSNVNAYVLRKLDTGEILRAVCTRDNRVSKLTAKPLEYWTSPTNTRYPVAWRLQALGLDLRVEPYFKERESPVLGEQESIWEGPVKVSGSHRGRGYQELVSYARERRLKK